MLEGKYNTVYDKDLFDDNRMINVIMFIRHPLNQIISSYNMAKVLEEDELHNHNKVLNDTNSNYNCINSTLKCNLDECCQNDHCLHSILKVL